MITPTVLREHFTDIVTFLKEEIHRLTFPKTFTILDKKAELEMIKDLAEDMGISLKDNTAKKIMSDIDITKQDMSYVELMAGVDKTELKRKASRHLLSYCSLPFYKLVL